MQGSLVFKEDTWKGVRLLLQVGQPEPRNSWEECFSKLKMGKVSERLLLNNGGARDDVSGSLC